MTNQMKRLVLRIPSKMKEAVLRQAKIKYSKERSQGNMNEYAHEALLNQLLLDGENVAEYQNKPGEIK